VTQRGFTDDIAQEQIINQTSRVSSDGGILFMETGPLKARASTLAALREEVSNALIRNGIDPRFQLEVTGFNSQTVTLIINTPQSAESGQVTVSVADSTTSTGLYPVTEKPLSLRELLVQAGLKLSQETLQIVEILRGEREYSMPVRYVFAPATPDYYLTGGDVVLFNEYKFKSFRAYALTGGSTPKQIKLRPMAPVYLSDVLFAEDGILSTPAARKWDIYVLRGKNPTRAYHLDATNPARLGIATELKLKPNDIVFASTKPIYDGATILSLINPFNALLSGTSD
jgi:protein involved in polysaccharide export with SLBB domain